VVVVLKEYFYYHCKIQQDAKVNDRRVTVFRKKDALVE